MKRDQKDNNFSKAIWDREGSTYMHRFLFYQTNKDLVGYSKKTHHHERNDKIALLTNMILRFRVAGWLDPENPKVDQIECMEVYYNATKDLLFRMYYTHVEWEPHILQNKDFKRLIFFMDKYYEMVEAGESSQAIYDKLYYKRRDRSAGLFDLDNPRFSSENQLAKYCQFMLEKKRAAPGEVENFFIQYKKKYLTQGNSREAIMPGAADMLEKFTKNMK